MEEETAEADLEEAPAIEKIEEAADKPVTTDGLNPVADKPKDSKSQNRWTKERIQEYLDDYAKLGVSDISAKWGISKSSVQPTASRLRLIVKQGRI